MNTRNDWKSLLELANEELGKKGYSLLIVEPEEGFFNCEIHKDGELVEVFAENYYEDELTDLITEAWHYAGQNVARSLCKEGHNPKKKREMKCYQVVVFNMNNPNDKDTMTLYAESLEDAEDKALSNYLRGEGYGILRSYECDPNCGYLSLPQAKAVRERVDFLLGMFMTDSKDRNEVVESLLPDVGEDIAWCAAWEDLDAEEYCEGDIDIALARIMKQRIAGE